jgi:membrane protease YdiL (CAAX protease family)
MSILRPIRNHPILSFAILACLFGWMNYIAYILGSESKPDGMPLGPIMAALIVAACCGKAGFKAWGSNLSSFRAGWLWYAFAFFVPIIIIVKVALFNYALGATLPTDAQLAIWTELPGVFMFFLIFVGIGEEAGWTAFAAPILLRRHSFLKAWVILASIRVIWHLPLMLSGDLPWSLGIGGNIAFQFLVLWIFIRGNQCWLLAVIWHATLNTFSGKFFFQLVEGADQSRLGVLMTLAYIILALLVFFWDRKRLSQAKGIS